MDEIRRAQASVERAHEQLRASVHEARRQGRTWTDIGEALGITRQAAFKRFGEVTNPGDGRPLRGVPMAITAIQSLTEGIFNLISTGDYKTLARMVDPGVRSELPESLISETWARVLSDVGQKESYSDTHVALPAGERLTEDEQLLGTVVGVTTINCEAGEVMGRVAFSDQGRVVGILIVPLDHAPLPF